MRTPWGASQSTKKIGPGITSVSTASHGGYKLDAEANAMVPDHMRLEDGWYEEDVDWSIVATIFPELYDQAARDAAERTLRNWLPGQWEAFYGRELQPGESHKKDEAAFLEAHRDDWLVISAMGDWKAGVPKGYVFVYATKGGRRGKGGEACFLVPASEYDKARGYAFVVDESRHERVKCA